MTDSAVETLMQKIKDAKITNVTTIVRLAMEIVDKESSGNKLELLNKLLDGLVSHKEMSLDLAADLSSFIKSSLFSDIISLVVDASKGKLNINRIIEVTQKTISLPFWNKFCRCFRFGGSSDAAATATTAATATAALGADVAKVEPTVPIKEDRI